MKVFFNWLIKTKNGRLMLVYWAVFFIIFFVNGFTTVRDCSKYDEEPMGAVYFSLCMVMSAVMALLTSANFKKRAK